MKKDLFDKILSEVCKETEISSKELMSNNRTEEVVDARHILVAILADYGFYPSTIASMLECSKRNITLIITNFSRRCNRRKLLRNNYERIKKHIGINSFNY